ncbi:MAG: c-type cytochrome [Anaerolineae bacterium]|nr:c-type cytochrome [Anaerolineae bacterium]
MTKLLAVILTIACLSFPVLAASVITPENASEIQMLGVLKNENMRTQSLVFTSEMLLMSISLDEVNQIVGLDLATQKEKILWENEDSEAERLASNGTELAFFSGGSLELLNITTSELKTLYTAASPLEEISSLGFNGEIIAAGRQDGSIMLLDTATGEILFAFTTTDPAASESVRVQEEVNQVTFSPDHAQIISGHASGWLRVWEIGHPEPVREWQAHRTSLTDLTFNPQGTFLATTGRDKHVIVWEWKSGTEVYNFSASTGQVDFSPDGQLLAAGGKSLHLWEMQSGSLVYQNFHADSDISAARAVFSPDGSVIVSGQRQVAFWGLEAGSLSLTPIVEDRVTAGEDIYRRNGCNGCHFEYPSGAPTLYGLSETAASRVEGLSAEEYIYQAIVDPDAYVVKGFPRGIHPTSYGDRLSQEEVWVLVEYILNLKARQ